jgi:glycosyltransferase involved in cell wall biosynthesis
VSADKPKIAYLLKTYPKLSETFILNEILGLEKLGLELEIFSLRRPADEPFHSSVAKVKAKVTYLPAGKVKRAPTLWQAFQMMRAHLSMMLWRRSQYVETSRHCQMQQGDHWRKAFSQAVMLAHALRRGKFDHLHAHFANLPTSVAVLVNRLCGIPYSFTAHAKDIYLTNPDELNKKIEGATSVLTCTGYNHRYLTDLSPGSTPIHLAYHGVDVARFDSASSTEKSGTPLILSVGRLCEKKGFPYLIRACRILKDRGFQFECRIIGFGELEPELKALIAELDVADRVALLGKMPQDQVIPIYQAASMFVLPCLVTDDGDRDGIPNVLMEAMVSRLPVISTGISGITELIEHMTDGILVGERDVAGIACAIEMLLLQPQLGQRLGENGRMKVLDRFALDSSAKRVHRILLQTVRGEHSRVESGDGSGMLEAPGVRAQLPVDAGGEAHG